MTVLHWLGHHWHDLAEAVSSTVQAAGIIAAGTFGYLRFVRGRVLHASLSLELSAELVQIDDWQALTVHTTIKNSGSLRQLFDIDCTGILEVVCLSTEDWKKDRQNLKALDWTSSKTVLHTNVLEPEPNLRRQYQMEPGENADATALFSLPPKDLAACRVTFTVLSRAHHVLHTGKIREWSTELVSVK